MAVSLSAKHSGLLRYRVADMSTAVPGEDFAPVSGSVAVNGSNAVIPITLLDDTHLEPVKLLAVDLVEGHAGFGGQVALQHSEQAARRQLHPSLAQCRNHISKA